MVVVEDTKLPDPYPDIPTLGIAQLFNVLKEGQLVALRRQFAQRFNAEIFSVPEDHGFRMRELNQLLGAHGTYALVRCRINGYVSSMYIPGPGETEIVGEEGHLMVINTGKNVLFCDAFTGLSSCQDYVLLGAQCAECDILSVSIDDSGLCEECRDLEERASLDLFTAVAEEEGEVGMLLKEIDDRFAIMRREIKQSMNKAQDDVQAMVLSWAPDA